MTPKDEQDRSGRVFLRGVVEDSTMVIDLVNFLHTSRRTGVLTVVCGPVRKSIYFSEGDVIAGSSNQPEDRFGDVMFRLGMITRAQLDEALRESGPGRKIGNVLLSKNLLTTSDLWKIIKVQIEEILYSVLLVESGEFTVAHFDRGQVPTRTALNTQHVLLDGLRRKDEMAHLRGEMPPSDRVLTRARRENQVRLTEKEKRVYDLIDGTRTAADLARESGLGEFETTRTLHHFVRAGLITELAGGSRSPLGGAIAAHNDAVKRIHDVLEKSGHGQLYGLAVDSFFSEMQEELVPIFQGVAPSPDGRLPVDPMLANLKLLDPRERARLLTRGLGEYLQFLLFLARETLEFERVEALAGEVKSLVRGHDS